MASHFSSIGLPIDSTDELTSLCERLVGETEALSCRRGSYLRWTCPSGAELWLQVVDEALVGVHPHFSGRGRIAARARTPIRRPTDSALDGAWHVWAVAGVEDEPDGLFPFVVDFPDMLVGTRVAPGDITDVQVAAFAHELTVFASDEDYDAAQADEELRYAAESFLPAGLFVEDGEQPEATAVLTGRIIEAGTLVNSASGEPFEWARVRTLGGEIDVVADPAISDEPMCPGGIVSGAFWLSGRFGPVRRSARRGLLGRLRGRGGLRRP